MTPTILHAAAVFPISGPCILNGAVAVEGSTIAAVGHVEDVRRTFPGAREQSFPNCVLLPSFINAHTHLELSFLRERIASSHFVDWVVQLIRLIPNDPAQLAQIVSAAVKDGMEESLRFGVTTVGDITRQVQLSREVLRHGPLRTVSFGEVQALGSRRNLLDERLAAATDASQNSPTLSVGLSPHAPYTVEGPALRQIVATAARGNLPLCMHLAELHEESEFLASLGGPLRGIWESLGMTSVLLDKQIPLFDGGPIRWAQHWGLLNPANHILLAHVNYATDEELDILAQSGASVAYCPRTRQFFGHDQITPHRWRDMLARGINVCLATDSLASNPDLSALCEAQTLQKLFPDTPPEILLSLITSNAAKALGMQDTIGTLEVGKQADVIAIPIPQPNASNASHIARILIAMAQQPEAIWIAGQRIVIRNK